MIKYKLFIVLTRLIIHIPFVFNNVYSNDHLVYSGACSQYDTGFCSRQVENSICNHVKNECFCRKGFVAIRENGRVTCKTLLTDLKCRVDRDCVHVNRSSCHPGAGYCSCPGSTIYVPERHACRSRFVYPNDPICDACIQLKGTCYKYEAFDKFTVDQRINPNGVGCVCPDHRVSISTRSADPLKYMCDGKLVDIGSECDDESHFCRSMNSICKPVQEDLALTSVHLHGVKSNLWSENLSSGDRSRRYQIIRTCQCKPGSLSVYQTNLKYNECFKILPMKAKRCQKCVDTGGQCYDLNDDGTGDGCECPPSLSPIVFGKDNSEIYCGMAHVSVNCTNGHFGVCYYPHTYGPYSNLYEDLINQRSVVRLASDNYFIQPLLLHTVNSVPNDKNDTYHYSDSEDQCSLKVENKTVVTESAYIEDSIPYGNYHSTTGQKKRFCLNIDVWRRHSLCGIRLYKLSHDTVQYEGILEVLINNAMRTPSRDKIIPLKCISRTPIRPMIQESGISQTTGTLMNPLEASTRPLISLRILSENNKEIITAFVGLRIRLDALLLYPSGPYKTIAAEYCYGNNRSIYSEQLARETGVLLIDQRCSNKQPLLSAKFSNTGLSSDHLQSDMFPAFRMGNMTLVFFTCVFRICQLPTDCDQANCKKNDNLQRLTPSEIYSKMNLIPHYGRNENTYSPVNEVNHIYKGDGYFLRVYTYAHIEVSEKQHKVIENNNNKELNSNYLVSDRQTEMKSTSSLASTRDRPLCNYALCLTTLHLTWILLCLFIILTLFCVTLILVYRKYQLFVSKRTFDKLHKQQHNQHMMQSSTVLTKNCYSQHSSPSRHYGKDCYQSNYILNPDLNFNSTIMNHDTLDLQTSFHLNPLTYPSISSSTPLQTSSSLPLSSSAFTSGGVVSPSETKRNFCDPVHTTNSNIAFILKNPNALKQNNVFCENVEMSCRKLSSPTKLDDSTGLLAKPTAQTSTTHSCHCQSLKHQHNYHHHPPHQHQYVNDYLKIMSSDDCLIHSSHIMRDDLLGNSNCTSQHETDMIDLFPGSQLSHNHGNNTFLCIQNIPSKVFSQEDKPTVTCSLPASQFYSFQKPKNNSNLIESNNKVSDLVTLKRKPKSHENYFKNDNSLAHLLPEYQHQLQCSGSMIIANNKPQTSANNTFSL
ncbi:unnamed protein product [Trichobilharzia szidati]|nr:unnamed protein product [Trichobilharzia szidati]